MRPRCGASPDLEGAAGPGVQIPGHPTRQRRWLHYGLSSSTRRRVRKERVVARSHHLAHERRHHAHQAPGSMSIWRVTRQPAASGATVNVVVGWSFPIRTSKTMRLGGSYWDTATVPPATPMTGFDSISNTECPSTAVPSISFAARTSVCHRGLILAGLVQDIRRAAFTALRLGNSRFGYAKAIRA